MELLPLVPAMYAFIHPRTFNFGFFLHNIIEVLFCSLTVGFRPMSIDITCHSRFSDSSYPHLIFQHNTSLKVKLLSSRCFFYLEHPILTPTGKEVNQLPSLIFFVMWIEEPCQVEPANCMMHRHCATCARCASFYFIKAASSISFY